MHGDTTPSGSSEPQPDVGMASTGSRQFPDRRNWRDYTPAYHNAFATAAILQFLMAVMTALLLDSGQTHRAFWVACVCQWAAVWIILFRRPMHPTRVDLGIVRYGIVPIFVVISSFGMSTLRLLGLAT